MVKKWRLALSVLALAGISSVLLFVANTNAENAVFQAVVDEYLSLTLDNTHMEVNVLPNMPFASGYVTATVNTNAAAGYTLTFQDADSRNGLEREGYDEATDKSPFNIPSVSADTTYVNLAADTWGYFLGNTTDTEATYKQIPLSATEIASDDEPAADATAKVNFGVKISDTRPSGIYEDTLTFSLVANPLPEENLFDLAFFSAGKTKDQTTDKYKIQDMTPAICDAVTTPTAPNHSDTPETQLVDTRDGKLYWVAKLMDGKCWMTQNLELDLDSTTELSSEDTDLTFFGINGYDTDNGYRQDSVTNTIYWQPKNSTLQINIPQDDEIDYFTIDEWGEQNYEPYSASFGEKYLKNELENNEYVPRVFYNLNDCKENGTPNIMEDDNTEEECTHSRLGNYYNWPSAGASNNSSLIEQDEDVDIVDEALKNSICPAGWRLPITWEDCNVLDEYGYCTNRNEYTELLIDYEAINRNYYNYSYLENGFSKMVGAPLYFVNAGRISEYGEVYTFHYYSIGGDYWYANSNGMGYSLNFSPGSITSVDENIQREAGASVRCTAKTSADLGTTTFDDAYVAAGKSVDVTSGKYKMHEMTPSICDAVGVNQIGQLVDVRDGTVYNVGKLKDKRCWLLDNLALDPANSTVKAQLSSDNTNATQAAITNYKNGGNPDNNTGWATEAVSYETNTSVFNQPRINVAGKDITRSSLTDPDDPMTEANDWKYGVYYNYCAASVGTYCFDEGNWQDIEPSSSYDTRNDICPAGWRMPTGDYDNSGITRPNSGEYAYLYSGKFHDNYEGFRNALRLPLSGSFYNGNYYDRGSSGYFWSSTNNYDEMYEMNVYTDYIEATGYNYPYYAHSVRCIAKGFRE